MSSGVLLPDMESNSSFICLKERVAVIRKVDDATQINCRIIIIIIIGTFKLSRRHDCQFINRIKNWNWTAVPHWTLSSRKYKVV